MRSFEVFKPLENREVIPFRPRHMLGISRIRLLALIPSDGSAPVSQGRANHEESDRRIH